jgi:hypothetical protein
MSYVRLVADSLGWTVLGRGFGGAGFPDPMTALAIACAEPWDVLTIALGTNSVMRGRESPHEFALMYKACLNVIQSRCPDLPVVCISPLVIAADVNRLGVPALPRWTAIRQLIHDIVSELDQPSVSYIDGAALVAGPADLAGDGVHPGESGHGQIASRLRLFLAEKTGPTLSGYSDSTLLPASTAKWSDEKVKGWN